MVCEKLNAKNTFKAILDDLQNSFYNIHCLCTLGVSLKACRYLINKKNKKTAELRKYQAEQIILMISNKTHA